MGRSGQPHHGQGELEILLPETLGDDDVEGVDELKGGSDSEAQRPTQGFQHHAIELAGHGGPKLRRPRHRQIVDPLCGVDCVLRRKQPLPHQHLPQHHADGPHVAAVVGGFAARLLWRHVTDLSLHGAVAGSRQFIAGAGDAEVADFDRAVPTDEYVVGADISVNDAHQLTLVISGSMSRRETQSHAAGHVGRSEGRKTLASAPGRAQQLSQVAAVDVINRHEVGAVDLAEVQELHDVFVLQADGDARLVDEHRDELSVDGIIRKNAFDDADFGDASRASARQKDLRHAADREQV